MTLLTSLIKNVSEEPVAAGSDVSDSDVDNTSLDETIKAVEGYDRDVRSDSYAETNRGWDTKFDERDAIPISVKLERIDSAILTHLRDGVKPTITEAGKKILVPVLYANAERWKQVRNDGVLRDGAGKIQTPIILFHRTGISRNSLTNPVNQYIDRTFKTGWNRHNAYDKFAVLNQIKPSRKIMNVKVPDYIDVSYEVMAWTDYVEQMNDLIELINYESDNYWGNRGDFKFKVTIDNYNIETDLPAEGDRIVKTGFNFSVKAYLLPETYYHTDRGEIPSTEPRYTYKKVVNVIEIDSTGTFNGREDTEYAGISPATGSI